MDLKDILLISKSISRH